MKPYFIVLIIIVAIVILTAGLWLSILTLQNPLSNPLAKILPWPVACTTRGCITTLDWQKEMQIMDTFSKKVNEETPTPKTALNTLIHQHLVRFGQLRNPIKNTDAQQYRENVLNLKDTNAVKDATGLSVEDYDEMVITPFLEQESLRQQFSFKTNDELYNKLASERFVLILPFRLK